MPYSLQHEVSRAAGDLRRFAKRASFAQAVALTRTAQDVKVAEQHEMRDSFDRPTPYTLGGVFVQRAEATDAQPQAVVGLKDDFGGNRGANRWLGVNIKGGSRPLKSFEKSIRALGVMDGTQFIYPGRYARLDAYGNISRGQIVQILSQLRAFTGAETVSRNLVRRDGTRDKGLLATTAEKAKKLRDAAFRRAGGQYFAVGPYKRGGLVPGIYQRQVASRGLVGPASPKPRLVMLFIDRARYQQRYDFFGAAEYAIARSLPRHLDAAMADALAGRS